MTECAEKGVLSLRLARSPAIDSSASIGSTVSGGLPNCWVSVPRVWLHIGRAPALPSYSFLREAEDEDSNALGKWDKKRLRLEWRNIDKLPGHDLSMELSSDSRTQPLLLDFDHILPTSSLLRSVFPSDPKKTSEISLDTLLEKCKRAGIDVDLNATQLLPDTTASRVNGYGASSSTLERDSQLLAWAREGAAALLSYAFYPSASVMRTVIVRRLLCIEGLLEAPLTAAGMGTDSTASTKSEAVLLPSAASPTKEEGLLAGASCKALLTRAMVKESRSSVDSSVLRRFLASFRQDVMREASQRRSAGGWMRTLHLQTILTLLKIEALAKLYEDIDRLRDKAVQTCIDAIGLETSMAGDGDEFDVRAWEILRRAQRWTLEVSSFESLLGATVVSELSLALSRVRGTEEKESRQPGDIGANSVAAGLRARQERGGQRYVTLDPSSSFLSISAQIATMRRDVGLVLDDTYQSLEKELKAALKRRRDDLLQEITSLDETASFQGLGPLLPLYSPQSSSTPKKFSLVRTAGVAPLMCSYVDVAAEASRRLAEELLKEERERKRHRSSRTKKTPEKIAKQSGLEDDAEAVNAAIRIVESVSKASALVEAVCLRSAWIGTAFGSPQLCSAAVSTLALLLQLFRTRLQPIEDLSEFLLGRPDKLASALSSKIMSRLARHLSAGDYRRLLSAIEGFEEAETEKGLVSSLSSLMKLQQVETAEVESAFQKETTGFRDTSERFDERLDEEEPSAQTESFAEKGERQDGYWQDSVERVLEKRSKSQKQDRHQLELSETAGNVERSATHGEYEGFAGELDRLTKQFREDAAKRLPLLNGRERNDSFAGRRLVPSTGVERQQALMDEGRVGDEREISRRTARDFHKENERPSLRDTSKNKATARTSLQSLVAEAESRMHLSDLKKRRSSFETVDEKLQNEKSKEQDVVVDAERESAPRSKEVTDSSSTYHPPSIATAGSAVEKTNGDATANGGRSFFLSKSSEEKSSRYLSTFPKREAAEEGIGQRKSSSGGGSSLVRLELEAKLRQADEELRRLREEQEMAERAVERRRREHKEQSLQRKREAKREKVRNEYLLKASLREDVELQKVRVELVSKEAKLQSLSRQLRLQQEKEAREQMERQLLEERQRREREKEMERQEREQRALRELEEKLQIIEQEKERARNEFEATRSILEKEENSVLHNGEAGVDSAEETDESNEDEESICSPTPSERERIAAEVEKEILLTKRMEVERVREAAKEAEEEAGRLEGELDRSILRANNWSREEEENWQTRKEGEEEEEEEKVTGKGVDSGKKATLVEGEQESDEDEVFFVGSDEPFSLHRSREEFEEDVDRALHELGIESTEEAMAAEVELSRPFSEEAKEKQQRKDEERLNNVGATVTLEDFGRETTAKRRAKSRLSGSEKREERAETVGRRVGFDWRGNRDVDFVEEDERESHAILRDEREEKEGFSTTAEATELGITPRRTTEVEPEDEGEEERREEGRSRRGDEGEAEEEVGPLTALLSRLTTETAETTDLESYENERESEGHRERRELKDWEREELKFVTSAAMTQQRSEREGFEHSLTRRRVEEEEEKEEEIVEEDQFFERLEGLETRPEERAKRTISWLETSFDRDRDQQRQPRKSLGVAWAPEDFVETKKAASPSSPTLHSAMRSEGQPPSPVRLSEYQEQREEPWRRKEREEGASPASLPLSREEERGFIEEEGKERVEERAKAAAFLFGDRPSPFAGEWIEDEDEDEGHRRRDVEALESGQDARSFAPSPPFFERRALFGDKAGEYDDEYGLDRDYRYDPSRTVGTTASLSSVRAGRVRRDDFDSNKAEAGSTATGRLEGPISPSRIPVLQRSSLGRKEREAKEKQRTSLQANNNKKKSSESTRETSRQSFSSSLPLKAVRKEKSVDLKEEKRKAAERIRLYKEKEKARKEKTEVQREKLLFGGKAKKKSPAEGEQLPAKESSFDAELGRKMALERIRALKQQERDTSKKAEEERKKIKSKLQQKDEEVERRRREAARRSALWAKRKKEEEELNQLREQVEMDRWRENRERYDVGRIFREEAPTEQQQRYASEEYFKERSLPFRNRSSEFFRDSQRQNASDLSRSALRPSKSFGDIDAVSTPQKEAASFASMEARRRRSLEEKRREKESVIAPTPRRSSTAAEKKLIFGQKESFVNYREKAKAEKIRTENKIKRQLQQDFRSAAARRATEEEEEKLADEIETETFQAMEELVKGGSRTPTVSEGARKRERETTTKESDRSEREGERKGERETKEQPFSRLLPTARHQSTGPATPPPLSARDLSLSPGESSPLSSPFSSKDSLEDAVEEGGRDEGRREERGREEEEEADRWEERERREGESFRAALKGTIVPVESRFDFGSSMIPSGKQGRGVAEEEEEEEEVGREKEGHSYFGGGVEPEFSEADVYLLDGVEDSVLRSAVKTR